MRPVVPISVHSLLPVASGAMGFFGRFVYAEGAWGEHTTASAYLAIDIHDSRSTCIMQAIPQYQPFIGGDGDISHVDMTVELPPLVPGTYPLTFWIGTPNLETQDFVGDAIAIKITDAPNPERTFPHYRDQGFMIANSTATVRGKAQIVKAVRR